jgi:signal transduction histidine kinase
MSATGTARAAVRAVLAAPVSRRALREFLYCLTGLAFILPFPLVVFVLAVLLFHLGTSPEANPALWHLAIAVLVAGLSVALFVASGAARRLGGVYRRLAASLLGERVAAPPPLSLGEGAAGPASLPPERAARMRARLRDRPSWRAFSYAMLKFPVAVLGWYAVLFWVAGLVNASYPFWWLSFRNHPPGTELSPVPVFTPFGWFGQGMFSVATFPGTFAAFGVGIAMLLAAPWVTRAVVSADRWLVQGLLGPGTLRQRLRDLELTRAIAVDDSAALLRQVERNLHDGAQIRLATLAMNLGMAREKLAAAEEAAGPADPAGRGASPGVPADHGVDLAAVRELVDAAHQGAKDALSELRELAKGIHPPVLDNGLADALATLAAGSAIPAIVSADLPRRPRPAIETIAYFCTAELLANAVKHSSASRIEITVTERAGALLLDVADDGSGGADPAGGGGLAGLAQRVRTVDGRLTISSPPGGPTRVSVELPLRA